MNEGHPFTTNVASVLAEHNEPVIVWQLMAIQHNEKHLVRIQIDTVLRKHICQVFIQSIAEEGESIEIMPMDEPEISQKIESLLTENEERILKLEV